MKKLRIPEYSYGMLPAKPAMISVNKIEKLSGGPRGYDSRVHEARYCFIII
ncbi:MAG: hypothetical protein QW562_04015 [Thermosphaera sp.]